MGATISMKGTVEMTTRTVTRILGSGRITKYSGTTLGMIREALTDTGCRRGVEMQATAGARAAAGMLMTML